MPGSSEALRRATVYCIVPQELAAKLHEPLRQHFLEDPGVEVIVETRARARRAGQERRDGHAPIAQERRRIRAVDGRRVAERRAALLPTGTRELPRRARAFADQLTFVERLEPSTEALEDRDTAALVARFQAGEPEAFATLYQRYFDRVYSYLLVILTDQHTAEDAAQHVFMRVFEALPRYERRSQPFRAWLFIIVRNHALDRLRSSKRLEILEPDMTIALHEQIRPSAEQELPILDWITDRELGLFVQRLPLPQRQVLVLRYMLDLPNSEIAAILKRNQADVRMLQSRALLYLRERLGAVRADRESPRSIPMLRRGRRMNVLRARRWALTP
jgi:RNA polymerase sigma-70 factor (ECF subfamily)